MNTPAGMKPFNLQEWQNGAKPICRNGYEPTDLHYFKRANVLVFTDQENSVIRQNEIDGSNSQYQKYDLFLKSEKKEGWVNLYKAENYMESGRVYNSEEEAKKQYFDFRGSIYLTTVKIEWYE